MKKNLARTIYLLRELKSNQVFRIMRLSICMLFICVLQLYAGDVHSQTATVHLKNSSSTLNELISEIEGQTEYLFIFSKDDIDVSQRIKVSKQAGKVSDILEHVFADTGIDYTFSKNYITLRRQGKDERASLPSTTQIKRIAISGKISDESGIPIIGANIVEGGAISNGTVSDIDGVFNLTVADNATLNVSFIGYIDQKIPVKRKTVFSIVLVEDAQALGEVVVTALGIKREEKALGYAVQKIDGSKMSTVKSVDMATSLTGKIAGLDVKNSTEFNEAPDLSLRGETPLLVVDGVPYANITLREIASDDIESIDVLKGATASALYGARGGQGAIMVTTKKAKEEGLSVSVNSSTLFNAGYLKMPEVQTSYSSGGGGRYNVGDCVWGDKMDIGRTAEQYNPYTYQWEELPLVSKGKNNLKNFQEFSFVTNNNVNVSHKGKYGSIRTSLTHVYNKGQFQNNKLNKFTYSVGGDLKYKNFTFEGGLTYNKRFYPSNYGTGYGAGGLLYNLVIWTGTEIDIRDYKNYWVKENEQQNWMDNTYYDNPYYILNEIISAGHNDKTNAYFAAAYDFTPWLKVSLRSGLDSYTEKGEWRNPVGATGGWNKKGYYAFKRTSGYSTNNDLMLVADKKFGDISINGLAGGTIYFWENDDILSETQNGLTIPGYYSLKASADPVKSDKNYKRKQVNSLYGKASASWRSTVFVDVTARNDWSSTLDKETRSYFYPSVSGSVVLSEFIPLPDLLSFWKVRGSWTQTKKDLDVYDTNAAYSNETNQWDGLNTSAYPTTIRGALVRPSATRSWEVGTAFSALQNKLRFDVAYYNKLYYNLTTLAPVSHTSGFKNTLINIDEEQVRKGFEVAVSGNIIDTKDLSWSSVFNWASDRMYYAKIDPVYSEQKPWVAKGERWDWMSGVNDYERDYFGNVVHLNGYPVVSQYQSNGGYTQPNWIWGFSNTVRYKDFTLSFSFDGRVGGKMFSSTDQAMWNSGAHIDSDNIWRYDQVVNGNTSFVGWGVKVISGSVDYDSYGNITRDNRVFAPNDEKVSYESYEKYANPYIGEKRTQNIFDQTFFKLRDLSLTYSCPKVVCEKLRMKGISVGFIGQNLLIWTKEFRFSDPDRAAENLNSPSIRYVGMNVKLDF